MTKFDPTKPVQTRDGRKARILCSDVDGEFPILSLIIQPNGREKAFYQAADGTTAWDSGNDLINIPEKHVRWVNVYKGYITGSGFSSKQEADIFPVLDGLNRIACIRVEFEEGEGL